MEAKLAAGPAISITKAMPGERPLSMRDRAIGMDPVAHIYIGIATITTAIMASSDNQTDYKPFADRGNHIYESIADGGYATGKKA